MTHYLTQKGLQDLQQELQDLKESKIPRILEEINIARSQGDLKENSALDAAKEEREILEARLNQIEEFLSNYEIIDESQSSNKVHIGSTVKVKYLADNTEFVLSIVGSSESNALDNKISNESPLALAILGKKAGENSKFRVGKKSIEVKILEILK